MNNKYGFTLTEIIIAFIVIGILALIAIPAYRGYVNKGIATEAKSLLNEVNAAQQIYYSRHGRYYAGTPNQQHGASFGVDTRKNKYFTSYNITRNLDDDTYVAVATYGGKSLTIRGSLTAEAELINNFN